MIEHPGRASAPPDSLSTRRQLRTLTLGIVIAASASACRTETPGPPAQGAAHPSGVSASGRHAIADTLTRLIESAYDLTQPDPVGRLMALYPDSGTVISATNGTIMTSRDSLAAGIGSFWEDIGRNMQGPRWVWGERHIEVLSPAAAVMTATYSIPHRAPSGDPHVVGGAWTAVFQKRAGRWRIIHEHLSAGAPAPPMPSGPGRERDDN